MKVSLLGTAASPFAHLLGRGAPAAKKMTDDEEAAAAAAKAKAEEDDDDTETEEEKKEREKKEEDAKKAKKAKAKKAEGDDDSDSEDDGDESAKAVRARERGRCAAIFADAAAGKRPDMAAFFAFGTSMTRSQAINALQAAAHGTPEPEQAKPAAARRQLAPPSPDLGGPGSSDDAPLPGSAAHMLAAMKAARGE